MIVTEKENYNENGKINDLEKELKIFGFARSHNGFLININHLNTINGYEAIMKDGTKLPISKKYLKELKKIYAEIISGVVI